MKKYLSMVLAFIFLFIVIIQPVQAEEVHPVVYLDGTQLQFEVPPEIIDGSTLVPLRKIFEEQGATVEWDQGTKTVTATRGDDKIVYTVGALTANRTGETLTLSVPGQVISGSTLVPLRFVSEALGNTVGWEPNTKTIIISSAAKESAVVKRVADGDTLEVEINGLTSKVRMIGIDTPESVHPDAERNSEEGATASDYTKNQLTGKTVFLEYDVGKTDKYGRILAYVYLESGIMYNATLSAEGYAQQMTIQPNVRWANLFKELVADAREHNRGLWANQKENANTEAGTTGKVTITDLDYVGEVVTIKNNDSVDINMTGWKLVSVKGNQTYNFPDGFVLKAGEVVKVVSGKDAAAGEGKLKWTTANVHNNDKDDPAELYDPNGTKVSEYK